VVAQMADRVAIMYAGRIVEQAPVEVLFSDPKHPYTQGLLSSMPDATNAGRSIRTIPGAMPALNRLPAGCAFHPRCTRAIPALCDRDIPPVVSTVAAGEVRCWLHLP
jgi:peptide/nickel transport system ATP-binding protein